jgi:dodecin
MDEQVYKIVELAGSGGSIEDAIQAAMSRADQTLRHLRWFEVVEIRGCTEKSAALQYQVIVKAGFTLEKA